MSQNIINPNLSDLDCVSFHPRFFAGWEVPFLGEINLELRGRGWDRFGFQVETRPSRTGSMLPEVVEIWIGRFYVLACPNTAIRPMKRSVVLAALIVAEVVRWCW